jgi:hypothetical protein
LAGRRNQTRKGLTMCDFSLQHAKSRPAVVADKLGSRLIKSTIRGQLQGRRRLNSFEPACRIVWRYA